MATETARVREARDVLAFFTGARDGAAVMDGAGVIWHHSAGYWYSGTRRRLRQMASTDLARALNPDLAHLMVVEVSA